MQAESSIRTKRTMYAKLLAGEFGNTVPQYMSYGTWLASPDCHRYPSWGVRTLTPAGPCQLCVPTACVAWWMLKYTAAGHGINISCMIDAVCTVTLWAEVLDTDAGLIVYGIERPARGDSWRKRMPVDGRTWAGVAARSLLRRHLNAASLDDLHTLLECYPRHVVELSATEECFGTVPHRNAVVWECRLY